MSYSPEHFSEFEKIESPAEQVDQGLIDHQESTRRSATTKFFRLAGKMATWGLIAGQSFMPGIEQALQRRGEPAEPEKTEVVDPEIKRNENNLRYLRVLYGLETVSKLSPDSSYAQEKAESQQQKTVLINTLEEKSVASNKEIELGQAELRKLLVETYPKNFVDTDVHEIAVEPGAVDSLPAEYGLRSKMGGVTESRSYGSAVALFSSDIPEMVGIYSHELGHANDWIRDVNQPVQEKIDLWRRVSERFLGGQGIWQSSYVDSISNPDAAEETNIKVTEYWGEINEQYFQHPASFQKTNPEDFALVDDWVKRQDPDFDVFSAAKHRERLVALNNLERTLAPLPRKLQADLNLWRLEMLNKLSPKNTNDSVGYVWHEQDVDPVYKICKAHGLTNRAEILKVAIALFGSLGIE